MTLTQDAWAVVIGAAVGAGAATVGSWLLAKRAEKAQRRAACLRIAAVARQVAKRLYETQQHGTRPIEGFAPWLTRFAESALSDATSGLDAAQLENLQEAISNAELAVRHIDRCGDRLNAGEGEAVRLEMQDAAADGLASVRVLLESLGDRTRYRDRIAGSKDLP